MVAGISRRIAVIPHHEHPVLGDGDPELHRRRLDHLTVLRVQVGTLVKGFPVDGHLTLDVAAGNGVAGHSDDAFDEVVGARVGQQTHELQHLARDRATILSSGKPVLGVPEHDDVTTMEVRCLDGHHAITDLQGVLHGSGGNDEHLSHEGSQDGRDDESSDDDEDDFHHPGSEPLPSARSLRPSRGACSMRASGVAISSPSRLVVIRHGDTSPSYPRERPGKCQPAV